MGHRLGWVLGAEVVKVCEEITVSPGAGPIKVASTRLTLPYARPLPARDELEALVAAGGKLSLGGSHLTPDGREFGDAEWARLVLRRMAAGPLPTGIEVEVQAIRVGDLTIVGLPGEVFAEIGFQIEQSIPGPAMVLGYSNGNVGYLCTQAAYEGGGYEPARSWMLYVHPAQFEPSNEHLLVRAGREVAAAVRPGAAARKA